MFRVRVKDGFSSAHMLRGYEGMCEKVHGHNYKVEVTIGSEKLDDKGILIDFRKIRESLKAILGNLDHSMLNDLPEFSIDNPSAENIARYIFKSMKTKIDGSARLIEVQVWETDNCSAAYSE